MNALAPSWLTILPEVASTNTWLKADGGERPHGFTVMAVTQSAGRGQRGNSWEAEPGKNLTFSMLLHPEGVKAASQFRISEAVCVGVASVLRERLKGYIDPSEVTVKWPNDVYVGNRKIAGILIENTIDSGGFISSSVAGIGININQRHFLSPAPNPVSLCHFTGSDTPLLPLLEEVREAILRLLDMPGLHALYRSMLFRADGAMHPFFIPDPKLPVGVIPSEGDRRFMATIDDVLPDGTLSLRHPDGSLSSHLFKEISFLISLNNN